VIRLLEDKFLLERIKQNIINHEEIRKNMLIGKKYYNNKNDILKKGVALRNTEVEGVLRNADNRIPHNHHQVLVDEKTSYLFTYAPILNINNDEVSTSSVNKVLGDNFSKRLKDLCIEASNCGVSWLHYWINNESFKYEKVPSEEIIPLYSNNLERRLQTIIRYYTVKEEVSDKIQEEIFYYIEYWTDTKLIRWKFLNSINGMLQNNPEIIHHKLGYVPFIEFRNNSEKQSDLNRVKNLIDLQDKVMSGYANDIEDITQCIYILENYGGENLSEFLNDLKRYKAVKTEGNGSLSTMSIDIPVEARKVLIDILSELIIESGQGLQRVENLNSDSSLALRFFYRRLELKAGLLESEFRTGIKMLCKSILRFLGLNDDVTISQTYTRNMISSDLENAQIAQMSVGVISNKTIIENHPWVDDPIKEEQRLQEEKDNLFDDYSELKLKEDDIDE
jgi:SPP1 family phage portal protein